MSTQDEGDLYISERTLAQRTGTSPRMWQSLRQSGGGPAFVRISARCVRYRWRDVERWLGDRTHTLTTDD